MSKSIVYCEQCGKPNPADNWNCTQCNYKLQSNPSSQDNPTPGKFASIGQFQQSTQPVMMMQYEPRKWRGGGLLTAIKSLYTSPSQTTAELLEDPNAPSPIILVFLAAILTAINTYFVLSKVTYVNVDVTSAFEYQYTVSGVKTQAQISAIFSFVMIFAIWWIGSWILGLLIKGGLPVNSVVRYNVSKSMRRLNAYRYFPTIIVTSLGALLLSLEPNRKADVSMGKSYGADTPVVSYTTNFSDIYSYLIPVLTIAATIVSVYLLYTSIKKGLNHSGSAPAIIAIFLLAWPLLSLLGISPI